MVIDLSSFNFDHAYTVYVSAFAALLCVWLYFRVTTFKTKRVKRISRLLRKDPETTAAIPTDVLSKEEERQEQRDMIKGVKSRFTIIRKTLIFSIAIFWALAIIFPYIGRLSSTMISIFVAITTAVVGIAARPLVENAISGVVISFSKQLRVGDTLIIDNQYGTVEDISITHTKIKTWDWKRYVIPNSRMLNKEFINLTLNDSLQWAYVEFSISYGTDIDKVQEIAVKAASQSEFHNDQEPPQFWVRSMEKENIICWIAAWANTPAEAWNLKNDIATKLSRYFHENGLTAHTSNINLVKNENFPSHS
ncbi:MAG: mechanosensitive ion channel family protein [Desulfovibrio sp.]